MNYKFLVDRRNELGLLQSDIADALGYTNQLVSLWETGKSIPSLDVWGKYASLLKVGFITVMFITKMF